VGNVGYQKPAVEAVFGLDPDTVPSLGRGGDVVVGVHAEVYLPVDHFEVAVLCRGRLADIVDESAGGVSVVVVGSLFD
jgi:hypothetical protein